MTSTLNNILNSILNIDLKKYWKLCIKDMYIDIIGDYEEKNIISCY